MAKQPPSDDNADAHEVSAYVALHALDSLAEHAAALYVARARKSGASTSTQDATEFLAAYYRALDEGDVHAVRPPFAVVRASRDVACAVSRAVRDAYHQDDQKASTVLALTRDEWHTTLLLFCADFDRAAADVAWLASVAPIPRTPEPAPMPEAEADRSAELLSPPESPERPVDEFNAPARKVSVVEAAARIPIAVRVAPLCDSVRAFVYNEDEERKVAVDVVVAHVRGVLPESRTQNIEAWPYPNSALIAAALAGESEVSYEGFVSALVEYIERAESVQT